jgi:hypothetical protein
MQPGDAVVLIVEADGPLGVKCGACGRYVAGTTYPVVTIDTSVLSVLTQSHRCDDDQRAEDIGTPR